MLLGLNCFAILAQVDPSASLVIMLVAVVKNNILNSLLANTKFEEYSGNQVLVIIVNLIKRY